MAACGSSGSSTTTTPATSSSSVTTPTTTTGTTATASTASASATSDAGPAVLLLHSVSTPAKVDLRVATPGGGSPARSVATLPANSYVLAAARGRVLALEGEPSQLVVVDLATAATRRLASDVTGISAAISPDGASAAFLTQPTGSPIRLQVVDLGTGATRTLATFAQRPVPDPFAWGPAGILADLIVPNSDAPHQGIARLDASTGAETGRSPGVGLNGLAACGDGDHVAAADHSAGLGDDGDMQGAPGPPQPANTLHMVTVGAAPATTTTLRRLGHHDIRPLDCPGDGSQVLVFDTSSAGGFAGITQSPDFGLLLVRASGTVQLDHYGTTYAGAVTYQDGATVAAERTDTSGTTLVELAAGHAPVTLDAVPGATAGRVDLISAR